MNRTIIHFDIDAFFASVEQLDNPEYIGKPLIVGGTSDRGVVATCSYEARKYGVKSAMSSVLAHKLCPNGIFVHGRMQRYKEISEQIFQYIDMNYEQVERVSIDEAYIDITSMNLDPWEVAKQIKEDVKTMTGLTISIGISYNKFLAKLASDWNKPNGIFEIKREDIPKLLLPLPIIKIHGLGKKSCEKLNRIGIFKIEDLYNYPESLLTQILGESWAKEVYDRIHGVDYRPVKEDTERKSYGKETTLDVDMFERSELIQILYAYLDQIHEVMVKRDWIAKTITLKVKYFDFEQITRSHTFDNHTNHYETLLETMKMIFNQIEINKPIRLIGLTISNIESASLKQLSLSDL